MVFGSSLFRDDILLVEGMVTQVEMVLMVICPLDTPQFAVTTLYLCVTFGGNAGPRY